MTIPHLHLLLLYDLPDVLAVSKEKLPAHAAPATTMPPFFTNSLLFIVLLIQLLVLKNQPDYG
jgi:hypothetical protein